MTGTQLRKTAHIVASLTAIAAGMLLLMGDTAGPQCKSYNGVDQLYEIHAECGGSATTVVRLHLDDLDRMATVDDFELTVEEGPLEVELLNFESMCTEDEGAADLAEITIRLTAPEVAEDEPVAPEEGSELPALSPPEPLSASSEEGLAVRPRIERPRDPSVTLPLAERGERVGPVSPEPLPAAMTCYSVNPSAGGEWQCTPEGSPTAGCSITLTPIPG